MFHPLCFAILTPIVRRTGLAFNAYPTSIIDDAVTVWSMGGTILTSRPDFSLKLRFHRSLFRAAHCRGHDVWHRLKLACIIHCSVLTGHPCYCILVGRGLLRFFGRLTVDHDDPCTQTANTVLALAMRVYQLHVELLSLTPEFRPWLRLSDSLVVAYVWL